jgi:hypothetical protein
MGRGCRLQLPCDNGVEGDNTHSTLYKILNYTQLLYIHEVSRTVTFKYCAVTVDTITRDASIHPVLTTSLSIYPIALSLEPPFFPITNTSQTQLPQLSTTRPLSPLHPFASRRHPAPLLRAADGGSPYESACPEAQTSPSSSSSNRVKELRASID